MRDPYFDNTLDEKLVNLHEDEDIYEDYDDEVEESKRELLSFWSDFKDQLSDK